MTIIFKLFAVASLLVEDPEDCTKILAVDGTCYKPKLPYVEIDYHIADENDKVELRFIDKSIKIRVKEGYAGTEENGNVEYFPQLAPKPGGFLYQSSPTMLDQDFSIEEAQETCLNTYDSVIAEFSYSMNVTKCFKSYLPGALTSFTTAKKTKYKIVTAVTSLVPTITTTTDSFEVSLEATPAPTTPGIRRTSSSLTLQPLLGSNPNYEPIGVIPTLDTDDLLLRCRTAHGPSVNIALAQPSDNVEATCYGLRENATSSCFNVESSAQKTVLEFFSNPVSTINNVKNPPPFAIFPPDRFTQIYNVYLNTSASRFTFVADLGNSTNNRLQLGPCTIAGGDTLEIRTYQTDSGLILNSLCYTKVSTGLQPGDVIFYNDGSDLNNKSFVSFDQEDTLVTSELEPFYVITDTEFLDTTYQVGEVLNTGINELGNSIFFNTGHYIWTAYAACLNAYPSFDAMSITPTTEGKTSCYFFGDQNTTAQQSIRGNTIAGSTFNSNTKSRIVLLNGLSTLNINNPDACGAPPSPAPTVPLSVVTSAGFEIDLIGLFPAPEVLGELGDIVTRPDDAWTGCKDLFPDTELVSAAFGSYVCIKSDPISPKFVLKPWDEQSDSLLVYDRNLISLAKTEIQAFPSPNAFITIAAENLKPDPTKFNVFAGGRYNFQVGCTNANCIATEQAPFTVMMGSKNVLGVDADCFCYVPLPQYPVLPGNFINPEWFIERDPADDPLIEFTNVPEFANISIPLLAAQPNNLGTVDASLNVNVTLLGTISDVLPVFPEADILHGTGLPSYINVLDVAALCYRDHQADAKFFEYYRQVATNSSLWEIKCYGYSDTKTLDAVNFVSLTNYDNPNEQKFVGFQSTTAFDGIGVGLPPPEPIRYLNEGYNINLENNPSIKLIGSVTANTGSLEVCRNTFGETINVHNDDNCYVKFETDDSCLDIGGVSPLNENAELTYALDSFTEIKRPGKSTFTSNIDIEGYLLNTSVFNFNTIIAPNGFSCAQRCPFLNAYQQSGGPTGDCECYTFNRGSSRFFIPGDLESTGDPDDSVGLGPFLFQPASMVSDFAPNTLTPLGPEISNVGSATQALADCMHIYGESVLASRYERDTDTALCYDLPIFNNSDRFLSPIVGSPNPDTPVIVYATTKLVIGELDAESCAGPSEDLMLDNRTIVGGIYFIDEELSGPTLQLQNIIPIDQDNVEGGTFGLTLCKSYNVDINVAQYNLLREELSCFITDETCVGLSSSRSEFNLFAVFAEEGIDIAYDFTSTESSTYNIPGEPQTKYIINLNSPTWTVTGAAAIISDSCEITCTTMNFAFNAYQYVDDSFCECYLASSDPPPLNQGDFIENTNLLPVRDIVIYRNTGPKPIGFMPENIDDLIFLGFVDSDILFVDEQVIYCRTQFGEFATVLYNNTCYNNGNIDLLNIVADTTSPLSSGLRFPAPSIIVPNSTVCFTPSPTEAPTEAPTSAAPTTAPTPAPTLPTPAPTLAGDPQFLYEFAMDTSSGASPGLVILGVLGSESTLEEAWYACEDLHGVTGLVVQWLGQSVICYRSNGGCIQASPGGVASTGVAVNGQEILVSPRFNTNITDIKVSGNTTGQWTMTSFEWELAMSGSPAQGEDCDDFCATMSNPPPRGIEDYRDAEECFCYSAPFEEPSDSAGAFQFVSNNVAEGFVSYNKDLMQIDGFQTLTNLLTVLSEVVNPGSALNAWINCRNIHGVNVGAVNYFGNGAGVTAQCMGAVSDVLQFEAVPENTQAAVLVELDLFDDVQLRACAKNETQAPTIFRTPAPTTAAPTTATPTSPTPPAPTPRPTTLAPTTTSAPNAAAENMKTSLCLFIVLIVSMITANP